MGMPDQPIDYQQRPQATMHGIERGVCLVGAVHALACCTYLIARAWPLIFASAKTVSRLSVAPSMTGILFQFILAVTALVLCLMQVFWPSRIRRQWVSLVILSLGIVWLLFGLMDDVPSWFSDDITPRIEWALSIVYDILREAIQFSTPVIVGYVMLAKRSRNQVSWFALLMIAFVCVATIIPKADHLIRYTGQPWMWQNTSVRDWLTTTIAFGTALLLILIFRRTWRWLAAMPMLAWIVRDTIVNGETRITRMRSLPVGEFAVSIVREMSYVTLTATTLLMGVVLFTILGLAKPRLFGTRDVVN